MIERTATGHGARGRRAAPCDRRRGQRGFSIVGAIFALVVLSALGLYMVSISAVQHRATLLGVLGTRADFAARAGIEWSIWQIVNNSAAGLSCGAGSVSFPLTGGAAGGFSVQVSCTATPVTEGAASYTLYSLSSTATRGTPASMDYVSRTLLASVAF